MQNNITSFKERIQCKPSDINKNAEQILRRLEYYYTPDFINLYKQHFSDEYRELIYHFPEIDFEYEGRLKNKVSLKEKVHRKLSEGFSGQIYDIYAKKIIIYSFNGKNDEESLVNASYILSNYLQKKDNSQFRFLEEKSKDYIANPKPNGYQAIHLIREHIPVADLVRKPSFFFEEVQIRTFRMEELQKFGTAAHFSNYKPRNSVTPDICPIFFEIGKNGKTYQLSEKNSFEKYKKYYEALIKFFEEQRNLSLQIKE